MHPSKKEAILTKAIQHVKHIVLAIKLHKKKVASSIVDIQDKLKKRCRADDRYIYEKLIESHQDRRGELKHLQCSPYFVRCDCKFNDENKVKRLYFGKFNFCEKNIYSWVARASSIRFENPGAFSYETNNGVMKKGRLLRKDQFMIVEGKIVFMATESLKHPRELIHQEYLTRRKTAFILPEIVEQMEKAQDEVIRAQPSGSFLIFGPAGSGKTTLALHRVAYLVQSPDTAEQFLSDKAIVFVQDESSRSYFSNLLPELGVTNVEISTFVNWAIEVLCLSKIGIKFVSRLGNSEEKKDLYEYQKNQALKNLCQQKSFDYSVNIYPLLKKIYSTHLSKDFNNIFEKQKRDKLLDRFDLTVLLKLYAKTNGSLLRQKTVYQELKNGNFKKKVIQEPIKYSLMVVDEVQNYLSEQVEIFRSCIETNMNAIIYVGDLAQQTHLCTLKNWEAVGEKFQDERKVELQKVYRTTKDILEYINSVGFNAVVPKGIKTGLVVEEKKIADKKKEILQIKNIIKQREKVMIGILAKQKNYLIDFKDAFKNNNSVKIMPINEAQGVEFDIVFLVGVNKEQFAVNNKLNQHLLIERKKVNKDLVYVALTRAMNELYVYGKDSLKEVMMMLEK